MKHFKLEDVKDQIDQKQVKSIMNDRSKIGRIYYRIRDGILFMICSINVMTDEIERTIAIIHQKLKDQKKNPTIEDVNYFTWAV